LDSIGETGGITGSCTDSFSPADDIARLHGST
jgi:hypothetical protein